MRIKNILKRCVATALAAAIGMTTLATGASAAASGINIGYIWDSSVNPHISVKKSAKSGGVEGQYIKAGEQICRFVPSSGSDWAFCIEPSKSMQGTPSGTWYTQYGFTKYDTFDLTDKNKADSLAYWKKIGGTGGSMSTYLGLVQYYGYSSHKNGNYYAATQLIIWEMILGYRGHTQSTFGSCSDVLWNDFIYPSGGWCTKSGVEKAYNDIVANVKNHYKLPTALKLTKAQAKDEPALLLKYNVPNMRYQAKFSITSDYVNKNNLLHNFSTLESKLTSLVKSKFSGTFGKDYGIEKSENNGVTTFTVWSKNRPFTSTSDSSIYTTDAVEMQMRSDLKAQETLFASSNYQTCLLSTKLDPVSGYVGLAVYNEPNLTVEKTFTDSSNNAITAAELSDLLGKTTFVIYCVYDNVKYYVQADKDSAGTGYVFKKYVKSESEATKFKTLKNTSGKGTFTVSDLPTSSSQGRTYRVSEYSVPDSDRYEKLSKSVLLPSPTSNFTANAGTKTLKFNNSETSYDAKFGSATLDKIIENGSGKTLSSDEESNISTLANIYKSTKFIVGYWDGNTIRYLTNGYTSAKSAFDGNLDDLDGFKDATYTTGDGRYYMPTKLNSDHKLVFDTSRTTTDISKAYVFSTGYNYTGTETCDYFGEIFLNFLPLDRNNNAQEIMFIEVNVAANCEKIGTITTDSNGIASNNYTEFESDGTQGYDKIIPIYPNFEYQITEVSAPAPYVITNKITKFTAVSESAKTMTIPYEVTVPNSHQHGVLDVFKQDIETKKPLANAEFEVRAAEDFLFGNTKIHSANDLICTMKTGADGHATTGDAVMYVGAKYVLTETKAPEGYKLNGASKTFEFNFAGNSAEYSNLKIDFDNDSQKGKITVHKTGDVFSGVTALAAAVWQDKDGTVHESGQTTYTPHFEKAALANAEFEIASAEDIVTADGTIHAKKGDVVAILITDANGYAESPELYLGKYDIRETKAPEGYVLNHEVRTVELTYAGQEIEVAETVDSEFINDYQGVKIHLEKFMEHDDVYNVGGNEDVKNVVFGLFAAEEITAADGSAIAENGLIATAGVGENMTAEFDRKIPFGKYYVQEIVTDEKYVLNGEKYLVTFEYAGQEIPTVDIDCGMVENGLKRGSVSGKKVNEHEEPLANAVFGIFHANCEIFNNETAIATSTSDENGNFAFENIPYGEYVVTEIRSPVGYVFSDKKYDMSIDENGKNIEITAVNLETHLNVSKRDIYGNELPGAAMQIIDSEGNIFDEWVSDGAEHIVTKIPAGSYTLHEVSSPNGYVISTDIAFAIDEFNVVTVENIDALATDENGIPTIVMVDDTTKIEVSKTALTSAENETNIMNFSDFNDDEEVQKVYDFLLEIGFTEDEINTIYSDEVSGKIDDEYMMGVVGEKSLDLSKLAELLAMKEDGRLGKLFEKYGEYEAYVKESTESNIISEELIGAVLQIIDKDGNVVDEWTTSAEKHFIEAKLTAGETYILHEVSAPNGYVLAEDIEFTVSADGSVDRILMLDDSTKVHISKTDITGDKELPGAKLQVIDENGNVVDEWISTTEQHIIEGKLVAGKEYTLHEEIAPDGYVVANDIIFTVSEDGSVDVVVMKDDTTKVRISKRDITTDEELPGAKLQIIDGDTVVEEWTSTNEAHFIEGKLVAGKEYTLREITAPDGFEIASDVTFTVNEDGSVTEVVMYDEHTPETPKTPNPHTGNDDRVMNVSLAVMAVCGCVMIMAKRRKKDKQR